MSWIGALLESDAFFRPCSAHAGGVVNLYNLETGDAVCPACAQKQPAASLLQVRRPAARGDRATSRPAGRNAARRGAAARAQASKLPCSCLRDLAWPVSGRARRRSPAARRRAAPRTMHSLSGADRLRAAHADTEIVLPLGGARERAGAASGHLWRAGTSPGARRPPRIEPRRRMPPGRRAARAATR
jgi:hypothetical protein